MLSLWTGTPGSGKSLHMAECIYWRIRFGKPVIANFEINTELFQDASSFVYLPNEMMTPRSLQEYAEWYFSENDFKESQIILFFDEAQIVLGNRDWKAEDRKDWIKFFTQHRKLGYDIILIAQFHEMIDKQVRTLVEYEVHHRKVNNVGWFGRLVSIFALGHPVVCAVTKWYGQKMRLSSEFFIGRKKFYRIYDTYKLFNT